MVNQAAYQNGVDPVVAFAQLWSDIKERNPSLQRVGVTPRSEDAVPTQKLSAMKEFLTIDRAKEARDLLLPQKFRDSKLPCESDPQFKLNHLLASHVTTHTVDASQMKHSHSQFAQELLPQPQRHGTLPPLVEQQQEKSSSTSERSTTHLSSANLAPAVSFNSSKELPASLAFTLNQEDFALAEACLDGLGEEDACPSGRSNRAQCEAAARALQRLGVDSTEKGAHLLLTLLKPLGLGGDNITPAQMKALLEALGKSTSELEGASPESLRLRLRAHLLGEEPPSPQMQQFTERSDLWPERSRQPPSGGCPLWIMKLLSGHQPSPFKRSGARDMMTNYSMTTSSMLSASNCDVLTKSKSSIDVRPTVQKQKSPQKKLVALPSLDSVVSCKTLQSLSNTSLAAKGFSDTRSKKKNRHAKIRYGDRRLPPILVEVT